MILKKKLKQMKKRKLKKLVRRLLKKSKIPKKSNKLKHKTVKSMLKINL